MVQAKVAYPLRNTVHVDILTDNSRVIATTFGFDQP